MKRCVIVPTFQRDELLYLCLEAIRAADPAIEIHVFPDRGTDARAVCDQFSATHHLTISHTYHGNSFNMLEALRWAHARRYDIAYVIEDDCIIAPDFFQWADAALARKPDAFAACGWRYSPDALPPTDGPDIVIPWYLSVCAAIPRSSLAHIVQHARPEYYSDMKHYLDAAYPTNVRCRSNHYEQDGLILRVSESLSRSCLWPRRPRAIHAGWYGYHMPHGARLPGTLAERVAVVRLILANPSLLHSMLTGGAAPTIASCDVCAKPLLTTDPAVALRCADCFHSAHPTFPRTATSHYYLPKDAAA